MSGIVLDISGEQSVNYGATLKKVHSSEWGKIVDEGDDGVRGMEKPWLLAAKCGGKVSLGDSIYSREV